MVVQAQLATCTMPGKGNDCQQRFVLKVNCLLVLLSIVGLGFGYKDALWSGMLRYTFHGRIFYCMIRKPSKAHAPELQVWAVTIDKGAKYRGVGCVAKGCCRCLSSIRSK